MSRLLSIVTITKADRIGLVRTKASIEQQQNCPDIEWVVVGATDSDLEVVGSGPAATGLCDGGISAALNLGARLATGRWISYLNSGDIYAREDVLMRVSPVLERLNANRIVVYGDFYEAGDGFRHLRHANRDTIQIANSINHQSVFIGRELAMREQYDERLLLGMDYDLWLRLDRWAEFHHLGFPVAEFHWGGRSSRRDWASHQVMVRYFLRKLNNREQMRARDIWNLSVQLARAWVRHTCINSVAPGWQSRKGRTQHAKRPKGF